MIISYYLTATQTLNFGYIKWTPDVAFTLSLPDIVFGRYFRQGMVQKLPLKMCNYPIITSFCSSISPMVPCLFHDKLEARLRN